MSNALIAGKNILVLGYGVTGQAVVRQLRALPAAEIPHRVDVVDSNHPDADFTSEAGVQVENYSLIIASPGWRPSNPILVAAVSAGIPVWSEIELAWQLRVKRADGNFAPWVGVTGTNGKTTTVGMLESILKADGRNALAVGNVGRPVIDAALDPNVDILALELSSFQLHFTHTMALNAAAVLNIAPDHIDWHGSYEEYAKAKGKIYEHVQTACVYNVADPQTRILVENADVADGARAIGFELGAPGRSELGLIEDVLVDRAFHMDPADPARHRNAAELATLSDLQHLASNGQLPPHIVSNALAAAALARAVGVSQRAVRDGLRHYQAGGHRIATVAEVGALDGAPGDAPVIFVDDSKATNAHAAHASLRSFSDGTVVWIAGGLAKGATFDELVKATSAKLRAVVVIGIDQDPMRDALGLLSTDVPVHFVDAYNSDETVRSGADVMSEAVRVAHGWAKSGDVVLMAPACASMDQFHSYAARGEAFAQAAQEYARNGERSIDG